MRVHTPLNSLKRYVIRNPDIPSGNTSESEYGSDNSDNENEAEETPTSPVPSDVSTLLYASSTNPETAEIPVHTPVDSDDNTLPDLTRYEPPTLPHFHTPSVSSEPPHVYTICVFQAATCLYTIQAVSWSYTKQFSSSCMFR